MTRTIHHIGRDRVAYGFDREAEPLVTVEAPVELMALTHDARGGRLRRADQVMATAPDFRDRFPKANPATGPVRIEGAEPGDSLAVEVLGIALDDYGFLIVKPDFGLVRDLVPEPVARICAVEDGRIRIGDLSLPVRPMIGVMATAPAGEAIATAYVGPHGGNIDSSRLTVGTTIHLPVRVPGALFYVGDVHASMGDAEVCGTGVEIGARVHLRLTLEKGAARPWPWMETASHLITLGAHKDYEPASEIAVREMMALLGQRLGVDPVEAFMLISAAGDVRVNQACRSPIETSVRCEFPKLHAGLARSS